MNLRLTNLVDRKKETIPNRIVLNVESIMFDLKRNIVLIESRDNLGKPLHGEYEISTTWKNGIPSMEFTHGHGIVSEPFHVDENNTVPAVDNQTPTTEPSVNA